MPQFPSYLREVDPRGSLAVPQAPTLAETFGAGAQDFGAQGEQTAIQVARANQFERQRQDQADHQTAVKGVLEFSGQQDQAYRDAAKAAPPGAAGFTDSALKNYDTAAAEKRKSIPASQVDYFDEQTMQDRQRLANNAADFQDASRVKYINTQRDEIVGTGASLLINNPEKLGFVQQNVLASIASMDASPDEKKQLAKTANVQLNEAALSGQIDANPTAALAAINAGKFNGISALRLDAFKGQATSAIRADEEHARAAQHERDYQAAKAQAVAEKAQREQSAMKLSDLEIKVSRGEAGYQDVESAYGAGKGWLDPGDRARLTLQLDGRTEKDAKAQAGLDFVAGVKAGAYTVDPKNSDQTKAVDADFLNQTKLWSTPAYDPVSGQTAAKTPQQMADLTIDYVKRVGVVPEALQGQIRGQLRNGSNDQMAASADLLEQFRQVNPALLDDFSTQDIERASSIAGQVSAGVPVPQAVTNTLDQQKVDKPTIETRTQAYADLTKPPAGTTPLQATQSEIQGASNSVWQRFVPFKTNPAVPPDMAGEYDLLKKQAYLRTGDMQQAQKSALDSIGRTWGQSAINGTVSWMKTPPENFYSAPTKYGLTPEQNTDWMKDQLVKDFTGDGALIDPSAGSVKERLSVIPSNRVNADGQPLYQVMFKDSMGNIGPAITTDAQGKTVPMLWAPDWSSSAKKQELDAASAKQVGQLEDQRKTGITPLMLGMMSPAQIKAVETAQQTDAMLAPQSAAPGAPAPASDAMLNVQSAGPAAPVAPASDSMLQTQSAGPAAPIAQPDQLQGNETTAEPASKTAAKDNPSFLQRIIKGATDMELGVLIKQAKGDVLDAAQAEKQKRASGGDASALPSAPGIKSMNLTPQENFLYQWHVNNITGKNGGKAVHNADGSTSTILQMSEPADALGLSDGKWRNIPSVWDGKRHTEDQAIEHAKKIGIDKWPAYATEKQAEARYQAMHAFMEKDVR